MGIFLSRVSLVSAALACFAANSLLCRAALGGGAIDAASFTSLRIVSGAVTLFVLGRLVFRRSALVSGTSWFSASCLFAYAASFSLAYTRLSAGTGALLLFGAVQVTMIAGGIIGGERPRRLQWLGLATACLGLLYLLSPGLEAPPAGGALFMTLAGGAWGLYSLRARTVTDPLSGAAASFIAAVPFTLMLSLLTLRDVRVSATGVGLALASGMIASGVGYVLWFAALARLQATTAATVQLAVPVLAAAGGALFLSESVTLRLTVASLVVLGGIALATAGRASTSAIDPRIQCAEE
jgi:drug/metabolite transporter (DMT)-like permease